MSLNNQSSYLLSVLICITGLTFGGCKGSTTSTAPAPKATSTPTPTPTPTPTSPPGTPVTLSGTITYDFISAASGKLNYTAAEARPIRNVHFEIINSATSAVIASLNTNDLGQYSLTVTAGISIKYRVYAEMISPSVIIQDNTNANAKYVLVTPAYSITGTTVKDIRAPSGWSGANTTGAYTATRAAAPFAVLDSVYSASKKVLTARPSLVLPSLKVNWSINNISADGDPTLGQITTSHYNPNNKQLYLLGQADVDSDEYDNHVIVHEWGHFFEDNLSRSDSGGGPHGGGDKKEMSLAFGEGWGNAFSAMVFDPDYIYADTYGLRQQSGFRINMETSSGATDPNPGWFSEVSIEEILYDLYDSTNENGNDTLSLGIGPILDVLTGSQKTTPAATSIFSFIYGLKTNLPASAASINTLVASKSISTITEPFGVAETHDAGWDKNLPLYNPMTLGGAAVPVYLYGKFIAGNSSLYNSVFNNKYIRFTASTTTTHLVITTNDSFFTYVMNKGAQVASYHSTAGVTYNIPTVPGEEYVINFYADGTDVSGSAIINLTVTGTAI